MKERLRRNRHDLFCWYDAYRFFVSILITLPHNCHSFQLYWEVGYFKLSLFFWFLPLGECLKTEKADSHVIQYHQSVWLHSNDSLLLNKKPHLPITGKLLRRVRGESPLGIQTKQEMDAFKLSVFILYTYLLWAGKIYLKNRLSKI